MEREQREPPSTVDKEKEIADCLAKGRFILINGPITEERVPAWKAKVKELLQSPDPTTLVVNTHGGDLFALYDVIGALMDGSFIGDGRSREQIRKVYTLAAGHCHSAGVEALMLGVRLDGAFATPDTTIQFHGSATAQEFPDKQTRMKVPKLKDFMLRPTLVLLSIKTGIDVGKLKDDIKADESYTAQQAKDLGIIEDIYDGPLPENLLT